MTDKQIEDNEYWKKKYADVHIRLTNKIAELEEQLKRAEQKLEKIKSYIAQEDWCVLDHISEEVMKIIEGEENE